MSVAVSIKVSLVLGVWLRDVRHLMFIRSGSELVELDLAEDFFCCARCQQILRLLSLQIVLYFVVFRVFSFLKHEEVIYFIFPSLFWSSHWSVCLVLGAEAGVPVCRFLCPSFIWKRRNSHCQAPFHSLMCFNPSWEWLSLRFFSCIQSIGFLQFRMCQSLHPCHS